MNLTPLTPPTDNLYKFLAIAGVTIGLVTFVNYDSTYNLWYTTVILGSAVLAAIGFGLWYKKLQRHQDILLEKSIEKEGLNIEKLKYDIEKVKKLEETELLLKEKK